MITKNLIAKRSSLSLSAEHVLGCLVFHHKNESTLMLNIIKDIINIYSQ